MTNVFDVFFPQLSNDVSSFSKIFHFYLQKVQNVLYLKKCIFIVYYDPWPVKWEMSQITCNCRPRRSRGWHTCDLRLSFLLDKVSILFFCSTAPESGNFVSRSGREVGAFRPEGRKYFFLPSRSKADHFLRRRGYFPECPRCLLREIEYERGFEDENGKFRKNYLYHW